jgi:hypothetical protein
LIGLLASSQDGAGHRVEQQAGIVPLLFPRVDETPEEQFARLQRRQLDATFVAISRLELEVGRVASDRTRELIRLKELEDTASNDAAAAGLAGRSLERSLRTRLLAGRSGADFDIAAAVSSLGLDEETSKIASEHVRFALAALDKVLGLEAQQGADGWPDPLSPPDGASLHSFTALDAALRRLASALPESAGERLLALWSVHRFPELRIADSVSADVAKVIVREADRLSSLWLVAEAKEDGRSCDAPTPEIDEAVRTVKSAATRN